MNEHLQWGIGGFIFGVGYAIGFWRGHRHAYNTAAKIVHQRFDELKSFAMRVGPR